MLDQDVGPLAGSTTSPLPGKPAPAVGQGAYATQSQRRFWRWRKTFETYFVGTPGLSAVLRSGRGSARGPDIFRRRQAWTDRRAFAADTAKSNFRHSDVSSISF